MIKLPWAKHIFTQRFTFNHLNGPLDKRLGLTPERSKAVFQKLLAVAKIIPQHSQIIESLLNHDGFTDAEKAFGIFALGEIYGMSNMMKQLQLKEVRLTLPSDMAFLLKAIHKLPGIPGALPGMMNKS